jgi:thiamine biosynthesis protein ThiI
MSSLTPDVVIIRLGELTLKGRNRGRFEKQIGGQLKRLLAPYARLQIREEFGRFYVDLNGEPYERIAEKLDQLFGIQSYSPAYMVKLEDGLIQDMAVRIVRDTLTLPGTFKISVRRVNRSFPHDTPELTRIVAGAVLSRVDGIKVDVHRPDCELKIEIRFEEAYLYVETVKGTGGFPLGTNGKALLMLSGGIDSPAAGWLAMRRGLELETVHFHSYPYTSERAKQKVIDLARRLSVYSGKLKLHLVPFTTIQMKLRESGHEQLMITMMRRSMLRITERIAAKEHALGIVTGESLGQVASQTLASLHTIGQVATLPIIRPLITMDKNDIIALSEKIETYSISILPYEDCCTLFVPKSPSTNPNALVTARLEAQLSWLTEEEERAVAEKETVWIRPDEGEFDRFF